MAALSEMAADAAELYEKVPMINAGHLDGQPPFSAGTHLSVLYAKGIYEVPGLGQGRVSSVGVCDRSEDLVDHDCTDRSDLDDHAA